jgi:hypothetical protein
LRGRRRRAVALAAHAAGALSRTTITTSQLISWLGVAVMGQPICLRLRSNGISTGERFGLVRPLGLALMNNGELPSIGLFRSRLTGGPARSRIIWVNMVGVCTASGDKSGVGLAVRIWLGKWQRRLVSTTMLRLNHFCPRNDDRNGASPRADDRATSLASLILKRLEQSVARAKARLEWPASRGK